MKKFIIGIVTILFASISLNAQTLTNNSKFEYRGGCIYQDGVRMTPDQLCKVFGEQTYNELYKPAKRLRVTGITMLSVGAAATAFGAGVIIGAYTDKGKGSEKPIGDVVVTAPGLIAGIGGAAVAITGGVLLGVGNKRLKNIVPASNGSGIAFAF